MRHLQAFAIGILFVIAGSLHFRIPRWYERMVPPFLPAHAEIVAITGFFEILGGVGVLVPPTREAAGWGLIALLIAIFPANIYMVVDTEKFAKIAPPLALYGRLPLQFLAIWWVYAVCVKET